MFEYRVFLAWQYNPLSKGHRDDDDTFRERESERESQYTLGGYDYGSLARESPILSKLRLWAVMATCHEARRFTSGPLAQRGQSSAPWQHNMAPTQVHLEFDGSAEEQAVVHAHVGLQQLDSDLGIDDSPSCETHAE